MNRFRIFLMLAILLATATAVHAQAPRYNQPNCPRQTSELQPGVGCPAATWYFQAWQDGTASLQRLRAMCATGQAESCCEGKTAAGVVGVAGSVKGCEVGQAPKACCCAKACACCESCKAKKETTAAPCEWNPFAQVRVLPMPPFLAAPNCLPPQCGPGIVQILPVQGNQVLVHVVHHVKPVHLVTPDLEAHCERMHHRGDVVVLEGNVLLLVKKHAVPIRIEAQRVLVNMRDGSFTVESDARPGLPTTFGVMRTSGIEAAPWRFNIEPIHGRVEMPRVMPMKSAPSAERLLLPPPPPER